MISLREAERSSVYFEGFEPSQQNLFQSETFKLNHI